MAILTEPLTQIIHGTNPENLVEKIVRAKIRQSTYWKQHCFGLTAETLVDKATDLDHTGGTHGGNGMPTPFLCLALKMLEIQPAKEIVVEFIKNEDYKYVRLLGAFYLRLTGTNADVYRYLDPLYNDYRKIRRRLGDGKFALTHVDQFVDELLTTDNCCDTALPRIQKRWVLEACGTLERRISVLEDDFEEEEEAKEDAAQHPMDVDEPNSREKEHYRRTKEEDMDTDRDMKHERRRTNRDHDRDRGYYDRNYRRGRENDRGRERDRDQHHHRIRDNDYEYSREIYYELEEHRRRRRGHCSCCSQWRFRDDGMREEPKRRKEIKETKGPSKCPDPNDPEIIAANKLRASLGLKPLR
jgi:pre-mRNA-splicing factor 38A